MKTFLRLKEFYWPYRSSFFGSIFFLFFVTAITVVYPIILKITIDDVILAGDYRIVPYIALGFVVLMVIKGVATYYHQFWGDLFGIKTVYALRNSLYKKLQYLPFRYYDNAKTGDLMSRLTADVEGFRFFLSFGFAQGINLILLVGLSFAIMLYFNVTLALVTLAAMPFLIVVVIRFDKKVHPAFKTIRKSFARLTTKVQENISGMNTVKSLSKEEFEINRFVEKNSDYKDSFVDTANIWAKYFPLMELIGQICVVVLLGYGGFMVINGQLAPGELVAFFSLVWYIIGPLMNLGFIVNTFSQSKASGERLIEILDEHEDTAESTATIERERLFGEIQFKNVSHSYDHEAGVVLKNCSFTVPAGKTIGLVGATGAGKTTLTQLISRFYKPTEGEIIIDGRSIHDYSLQSLRANIAIVLQESFLFSCSIKDNIAYGRPEASLAEIEAAAKRADAHEFICELPDGYETVLGERGMGLSGGQKQRIAIARALLINPTILIFDDATSAVDMETETKIQQALQKVMEGRTTFIIAHRISSVMHADEILVLEKGEIRERGTHRQLIENEDGIYRRIYNIQFKDREVFSNKEGKELVL